MDDDGFPKLHVLTIIAFIIGTICISGIMFLK
jgi:hypothetical protein